MSSSSPEVNRFDTHTVTNQPPPLAPYDAWSTDLPLQQARRMHGSRKSKAGPCVPHGQGLKLAAALPLGYRF